MKVGIMISGQTPQAGGGFTFEDEVLEAFFRLRRDSPHTYFLVGYRAKRPEHLEPTGLPYLSLARTGSWRRQRNWERIWKALQPPLRHAKPPLDFLAYPEVAAAGLDFICYLTPLVRPMADIPYLTIVWDLEHRLKPFLPELGPHGEWDSRERRYRQVLPRAAYVVALNRRGRDEVRDFYGLAEERIRALTLPTPSFALRAGAEPDATAAVRARLGIREEYFFYPAQFWPHKNHVCLLLALKEVKEKHGPAPQLVLTGSDKGSRAFVEKEVRRLGLEDNVLFPGFVSREELVALYRGARALVFPSLFGPENLPPLEAFALGCPVIASALAGHEVQLGEAARLVDPLRPELWAEAIQQLRTDDAARNELIARGRVRAGLYIADDFVRDLFKMLDEFAAYRRCWPGAPGAVPN